MESNLQIKCRKCRTVILKVSADNLLDAHSEQFSKDVAQIQSDCPSIIGRTEIFLNEDTLDQWIQDEIEKSEWTKGKLKCFKCTGNVGCLDLTNGAKM